MLYYFDRIFYRDFILKPLLCFKNHSFSFDIYNFQFQHCLLSFTLKKNSKLVLDGFRAGAFLHTLTRHRPRLFINRKTSNVIITVRISFQKSFLLLRLLTNYFVTTDRINSLQGPFINHTGTCVGLELHDLVFFSNFLQLDADYFDFNYPLKFFFIKNRQANTFLTLLETWNFFWLYGFALNHRFRLLLDACSKRDIH